MTKSGYTARIVKRDNCLGNHYLNKYPLSRADAPIARNKTAQGVTPCRDDGGGRNGGGGHSGRCGCDLGGGRGGCSYSCGSGGDNVNGNKNDNGYGRCVWGHTYPGENVCNVGDIAYVA